MEKNKSNFLNPTKFSTSLSQVSETLGTIVPVTATVAPTIMAAQAPSVVPLSQYNPPMITAPTPPANMANVTAK